MKELEPIPLSKIIRYKDDFYKHTIPEDSWSILVCGKWWFGICVDEIPLEVKSHGN